jgi:hypothetical protein
LECGRGVCGLLILDVKDLLIDKVMNLVDQIVGKHIDALSNEVHELHVVATVSLLIIDHRIHEGQVLDVFELGGIGEGAVAACTSAIAVTVIMLVVGKKDAIATETACFLGAGIEC